MFTMTNSHTQTVLTVFVVVALPTRMFVVGNYNHYLFNKETNYLTTTVFCFVNLSSHTLLIRSFYSPVPELTCYIIYIFLFVFL